jgi:hypothetical protein
MRPRIALIVLMSLQPNRMPGIESARRAVRRIPTRRPFAGVIIEWGGVEAQPGNDGKRVALARVDCDPFACAAFAVATKLGRAHRGTD